jgi:hypothetical protein
MPRRIIMTKLEELKQKYNELQNQIKTQQEELRILFKSGLEELFKLDKNIKSLECRINNHEFNDGDATYFSLYYEDLTMTYIIDELGNEIEVDGYNNVKKEVSAIRENIVGFFKQCDIDNFYEDLFGEKAYESISFNFKDNKLNIEF